MTGLPCLASVAVIFSGESVSGGWSFADSCRFVHLANSARPRVKTCFTLLILRGRRWVVGVHCLDLDTTIVVSSPS